jgi:Fe-S-cluster-containing dehydrogenase component
MEGRTPLNSVEQLQGRAGTEGAEPRNPRLFMNLDICSSETCPGCVIECSYPWHREINRGIQSVIELATYALVCRRCEEPHCVMACPVDALEKSEERDGMLVRHTFRCVSCRSCSHACPYGTIYPEMVPRFATVCDYCLSRRGSEPACIPTCPYGALTLIEGEPDDPDNCFAIGENLLVHSIHWKKEKA